MTNWMLITCCGLITFLTRFSMIALLKKDTFNKKTKIILSYVPSAIFPAIIFPLVFLDDIGNLELNNNPKILAALVSIVVGFFSKNVLATIFTGLISYWILIFF